MKSNFFLLISAAVGIVCGLASHIGFLSAPLTNLALWGLAGLGLGIFANGRRMILWTGIVYGVSLSFSFLLSGFGGRPEVFLSFILLTLLLSVIGALGGLLTVFIGSRLRTLIKPSKIRLQ